VTRFLRWFVRFALPPLALLALVLISWHLSVVLLGIKRYVVPKPAEVLWAGWEERTTLFSAAMMTGKAAVAGFICSFFAGLLTACLFSQSRTIQRSVYPYAIFLQTVPIVAVAPLIVNWFGYGLLSVVVVAFIISLFPIITNATTGLTAIDPHQLELFELAGASRWQTLRKLRLPSSVSHLVTGAKISSGLSVVGAIVGEIFAGAGADQTGLGYLITQWSGFLKTPRLFAAVLTSAVLGIVIFGAVSLMGAWIVSRWYGEKLLG
jgi:NitT/TauT family transport system permease protein